jgi:GntR family transcriptional regulator
MTERTSSLPLPDEPRFRHPGPPLYSQLADYLRQQITGGALQPGTRLPSLHELRGQFGVARVTARQAVQLLVEEGFLASRQGRGTHVVHRLPSMTYENMRTSWSAMVKRIEGAQVELLHAADVTSCPLLAADEPHPAPVYHYMKRVHIKEGVRFALIELYLDKRIYDLAPARFNETTVIPVMGEMDVYIESARQILTIGTASVEAARHLDIPIGSPVALVDRVARDRSGCAVYVASMVHPGQRVRFDIDLVR